jgi:hypothetical protein
MGLAETVRDHIVVIVASSFAIGASLGWGVAEKIRVEPKKDEIALLERKITDLKESVATSGSGSRVAQLETEKKSLSQELEQAQRRIDNLSARLEELGQQVDSGSTIEPGRGADKELDGTVGVLSEASCWEYEPEPISLGGILLSSHASLNHLCDGEVALTFDIRGWDSFEGAVGIASSDARPNNLTIKVDGSVVDTLQVKYNQTPRAMKVDLRGHKTLTFEKSGRYPIVVIGEPKLHKEGG